MAGGRRPERRTGIPGLLRDPGRAADARRRPTSRRPSASSRAQHHPDLNKGDRPPSAASRRSTRRTRSSPIPRSASGTTSWAPTGSQSSAPAAAAATRSAGRPFAGFARRRPAGPGGVRYEYRSDRRTPAASATSSGPSSAGPPARRGEPARRTRSPRRGRARRTGGESFEDILAGMGLATDRAASGAARRPRPAPERPPPRPSAEVTLEEAYHGTTRLVEVDGRRLEVTIPRGVGRPGSRIRLSRQGRPGGRRPLRRRPASSRTRCSRARGADLERELPVTLREALLGAEVPVRTLKGRVLLRIPPGTQNGRTSASPARACRASRPTATATSTSGRAVVLPTGLADRGPGGRRIDLPSSSCGPDHAPAARPQARTLDR